MKRLLLVLLMISVMLSFASCAALYADRGGFVGGEMLDYEKMAEIRAEVMSAEFPSEEQVESTESINESATKSVDESDKLSTEEKAETPKETEADTNNETVYWMSGGSVWHLDKDCRYIKGKEVISGSQAEAMDAGKERVCSSCAKK